MKIIFRFLLLLSVFTLFLNANNIIDIDAKIEQAKKEKKTIMFFFHVPHCQYCKSMLSENFKDNTITELIEEKFILVDIYTADEKEVIFKSFKGTPSEFGKHIGAYAYPATLFMDINAKVIHKAIAYRNIDEFLIEMKYIATQSYKQMDLEAFKLKIELEEDE